MLTTLLESDAPRQRRGPGTAASIGIHAALIAAAAVATASAGSTSPQREPEPLPRTIYIPRQVGETESRRATVSGRPPAGTRLERLQPPDEVVVRAPLTIPTAALGEIDPEALLRVDTLASGPRARLGGDPPGSHVGDQPATIATVEKAASLLAPPRPRYPDQLRAAGVSGRVVLRFVVDTMGRVEPASVVVRESSHDLFEASVRAILPALRFTAAELGARKVRMLVELPFEFRLDP